MICPTCTGRGYDESPHFHYGRMECPVCGGCGVVNDQGEAMRSEDLEGYMAEIYAACDHAEHGEADEQGPVAQR